MAESDEDVQSRFHSIRIVDIRFVVDQKLHFGCNHWVFHRNHHLALKFWVYIRKINHRSSECSGDSILQVWGSEATKTSRKSNFWVGNSWSWLPQKLLVRREENPKTSSTSLDRRSSETSLKLVFYLFLRTHIENTLESSLARLGRRSSTFHETNFVFFPKWWKLGVLRTWTRNSSIGGLTVVLEARRNLLSRSLAHADRRSVLFVFFVPFRRSFTGNTHHTRVIFTFI